MRRTLSLVGILLGVAALAGAQQKTRVAVLDFDYATVNSSVSAIFGTNTDVGKGIADLIVEKLVTGGTVSVIERKAIDKIMTEQNFSNSDRADASSAAKLGRLLGVEAIIIGSITQFGRDDSTQNIGGSAVGGITGRFGVGGFGRKKSKAVVALTGRVISTDTGEILAVANGKGESDRSGTGLLGAGGSSSGAGAGAYDLTSKNFGETIIGEAVTEAVASLSKQLESNAASIPAKVITVQGLVADVAGDTLVLNVGSKAGVKVGDRLEVSRVSREVRDPASGKVIRRIEDKLGEVVISEVDELSAVGKLAAAAEVKVGDTVKTR